jgi:hypothetical protein
MDLTRYWQVSHKTHKIEVQWTGMRITGGWTLRLLIDGQLQAERKSGRDILIEGKAGEEPISVRFHQGLFRNRCIVSAGETVLQDSFQPWNALALLAVLGVWVPLLGYILMQAFSSGVADGLQDRIHSMPR